MLINILQETVNTLEKLISLTKEDIENIKFAKHESVFNNMKPKEELAEKFAELKTRIDRELVKRNRPLNEIFSKEEEVLFEEFKRKLLEFNSLHKRFAKLALSVTNFYNTLMNQIQQKQQVNYDETFSNSKLKLKA